MGIVKTLKENKLVQFIKDLLSKLKQDDAIPYAYQLSYRLMLAIFPFLIFLLTLVGFIYLDPDKIIEQIEVLMPGEAFGLLDPCFPSLLSRLFCRQLVDSRLL